MKSWISKALLGLFIAAPTFARLPTVPNRYTGIMVETSGLTMTQRSAIVNAFGVWFQDMQFHVLNDQNAAFRIVTWNGAEDFGATVKFQLVAGTRPGICPLSYAVDYCGVEIIGDDGVNPEPTVKVYTSVKRTDGTLTTMPLSDRTAFQNIAIRTVGRILGVGVSNGFPVRKP